MDIRQHVATVFGHAEVFLYSCPLSRDLAYNRSLECISQDPSTNRRHPRGYIDFLEQHNTTLENHVAFLEQTIRDHRPDLNLDTLLKHPGTTSMSSQAVDTTSNPPVASPPELPPSRIGVGEQINNGQIMDDPSSLELLCLRSAGADPHYFGASSAYSFTKMFSASLRAVRKQGPGLTMSGVTDTNFEDRPSALPAPLPNRAVVNLLTTSYFEQVHPQFPFIHRLSYLQCEEEVLTASEAGLTPNPVHAFFVYAVSLIRPVSMVSP